MSDRLQSVRGGKAAAARVPPPAPPLVGESAAMRRVVSLVDQVAPTGSTVLIGGETGVGKEVVARSVHHRSHLRAEAFVVIGCGAAPPHVFDGPLLPQGSARGGACPAPLFPSRRGGTLFLDEVAELPATMQVQLLRLIEDREVGAPFAPHGEIRIVAATSRDLPAEVEAGRFREDLFYRLNVIHLEIPPLRDRREDIPPLVGHMVARHNARLRTSYRGADAATLRLLLLPPWKGNVRELGHAVEYAMVVGGGEWIRPENLPPGIAPDDGDEPVTDNLAEAVRRFEQIHVESVLQRTRNDRRKAAEILGIDLSTLYRKLHGFAKRDSAPLRR